MRGTSNKPFWCFWFVLPCVLGMLKSNDTKNSSSPILPKNSSIGYVETRATGKIDHSFIATRVYMDVMEGDGRCISKH